MLGENRNKAIAHQGWGRTHLSKKIPALPHTLRPHNFSYQNTNGLKQKNTSLTCSVEFRDKRLLYQAQWGRKLPIGENQVHTALAFHLRTVLKHAVDLCLLIKLVHLSVVYYRLYKNNSNSAINSAP